MQRGMPDVEHEWNPRPRTYASEVVLAAASPVTEHPLQPKEKAEPKPTGAAPLPEAPMDPLSLMMAAAKLDPLGANDPLGASGSAPGAAFSSVGSVLLGAATHDEEAPASRFLTWKHRRADILKQYAVAGQIKINSDLLNVDGIAAASLGSNLDDGAAAADKKVNMLDAKTRGRLEQLEQAEGTADESRIIRLTQQELVSRVDKLNVELGKAWEAEERVRALKIAIQVRRPRDEKRPRGATSPLRRAPHPLCTRLHLPCIRLHPPSAGVQDARRHRLPSVLPHGLRPRHRDARPLRRARPRVPHRPVPPGTTSYHLLLPFAFRPSLSLQPHAPQGTPRAQARAPCAQAAAPCAQAANPCDAGELVYARVHAKGQAPSKTLREGFAPSEVLEEGVETTKNWFYKVASIRELVPRFYVELAILKCYRLLLPPAQIVANVRRMSMTRSPDPNPNPNPNPNLGPDP